MTRERLADIGRLLVLCAIVATALVGAVTGITWALYQIIAEHNYAGFPVLIALLTGILAVAVSQK